MRICTSSMTKIRTHKASRTWILRVEWLLFVKLGLSLSQLRVLFPPPTITTIINQYSNRSLLLLGTSGSEEVLRLYRTTLCDAQPTEQGWSMLVPRSAQGSPGSQLLMINQSWLSMQYQGFNPAYIHGPESEITPQLDQHTIIHILN